MDVSAGAERGESRRDQGSVKSRRAIEPDVSDARGGYLRACKSTRGPLSKGAVSALLYLTAAISLLWSVALVGFSGRLLGAEVESPLTRSLVHGLAITHVVLAFSFLYAARAPATNRGAIYAAILLVALKMGNDIYELLVLLPAEHALVSLADLVVSVALLVGLLEALPRTFSPSHGATSA
jgi:hypothetical protein